MTDDEREQFLKRVAQHNLSDQSRNPHWPAPGETWRHYKGGTYDILALAVHESELTPLVVYRSHQYGYVWARPLSQWLEPVQMDGKQVPRFTRMQE